MRSATGGDAIQDTYQARLESMLNPDTESVRTVVAVQEKEAEKIKIQEQVFEEEYYFSTGMPDQTDLDREEDEEEQEDSEQESEKSKIDATERHHYEKQHAIYQQLDEQKVQELLELEAAPEEPLREGKAASALKPSLANNPFYFEPISDAEYFEARKGTIVSKLLHEGYSEQEANDLVLQSTSQDELIIQLMEDDFTFGEAMNISK